jgi:hypothetical protein
MSQNLFNGPKEILDVIKNITENKSKKNEDHMPNDEVLYKMAKDSGRKNPGETGDSGVEESLQPPQGGDGHYYDKEKIRRQMGGDPQLGEYNNELLNKKPEELSLKGVDKMKKDVADKKVSESPDFGPEIHQDKFGKYNSSDSQLPKELDDYNKEQMGKKKKAEVKENYASPEPNSAVGKRRVDELPKNVDVVIDSSMYGAGYRVLISFPNKRPLLFPEAGKESARSKGELVASIPSQYISYCVDKIDFAFKNAKEHNQNFQGDRKDMPNYTPNVVKGQKS